MKNFSCYGTRIINYYNHLTRNHKSKSSEIWCVAKSKSTLQRWFKLCSWSQLLARPEIHMFAIYGQSFKTSCLKPQDPEF